MEIKTVDINSIFIDPSNARKHPQKNMDAIKGSISKFQQVEPLVVQKSKKIIIGGNGRYQAMKELGFKEVQIVEVDLTDTQSAALAISLNRTGELAEWDLDILPDLLLSLQQEDFDLASIGFDEDDLNTFIPEEIEEGKTDPDAVPENVETRCKPGDLWILGNHRLLCGDSTNVQHVGLLMNGEKADMVFTDPPWNVNYGGADHPSYKKRQIMNDSMTEDKWQEFVHGFCVNLFAFSKPGSAIYLVMSAQEWPVIDKNLRDAGFHWSSTIIWAKDRLVMSRKDYHTQYEPIWYGWNGDGSRLFPLKDRKQTDLWNINRPSVSELHPTTKPVELIERALNNSSDNKSVVMELFGGSGSTLIACQKTGRRCMSMELDPKYCDVIIKRWEDFTGQTAVLYTEPG